ncbi:MAG: hypothetical protein SOZ62_01440 [Eubacteriales bacterium]|nr:hypothetical protein [Eubacteriales bacterium]
MAFSATFANIVPEEKLNDILSLFHPLLTLSLVVVIVNLGMLLDYRLIAGAGLFTFIYIVSCAAGTIVAAAIINEIIAVIAAKIAFRKAGEIN